MNRFVLVCAVTVFACSSLLGVHSATAQTLVTLELRWKHDFDKGVSWYVRTSAEILIVRSGRSLTAIDGRDGRQLWELEDVQTSDVAFADVAGAAKRGLNVLEVPGMGVLLLNGIKLPGNSERQLVALNLMTGERLWEAQPVDEMMTVIPLYESGQIVVVSRRVQKKILAAEAAASAFTLELAPIVMSALPHPYRFELERLDLATGNVEWNSEYPRTFPPGLASVKVFGDHLFIYFANHLLGCVDLTTGKQLWEDTSKRLGYGKFSLPVQVANGRLIYASADVEAVDPGTRAVGWRMESLGKIKGIFVHDGVLVATGDKRIAAVDTATGIERWHKKIHGSATNMIWDKSSDGIVYADWKGMHSVERSGGKELLNVKLNPDDQPYLLRLASPETFLTISTNKTNCYSLKTGKWLFEEGTLNVFYRGLALLDEWPMPEEGQILQGLVPEPSGAAEWDAVRKNTLLPAELLAGMEHSLPEWDGSLDVYQTGGEDLKTKPKIWWVDGKTNRQMVIRPAAEQHDVSRPFANVYAVKGKMLWAAKVKE